MTTTAVECRFSAEHDAALCAAFPALFANRHERPAPISWGFQCGDGWNVLIYTLCEALQAATEQDGAPQLRVAQIKEKFAELRFYVHGNPTPEQHAAIQFARRMSLRLCEVCGAPGGVCVSDFRFFYTRCEQHRSPGLEWTTIKDRPFHGAMLYVPAG